MPLLKLDRPTAGGAQVPLGPATLHVSFDGGVRGNGRADCTGTWGVVAKLGQKTLWTGGGPVERPGKVTNNVAEFEGLSRALRWVRDDSPRAAGAAVVKGDSQFVVRAVTGEYAVSKAHLLPLVRECRGLLTACRDKFPVSLKWVPREENREADRQAARAKRADRPQVEDMPRLLEVGDFADGWVPDANEVPEGARRPYPGSAEGMLDSLLGALTARCTKREDRVQARAKVYQLRQLLVRADRAAGVLV